MNPQLVQILRTLHVIAALAWVGEVVVINVVLLPASARLSGEARLAFMRQVFPRIFVLASFLSGTAVVTGLLVAWGTTRGDLSMLLRGRWGISILIGATLGTSLTAFHFFLERRVAPVFGDCGAPERLEDVHTKLQVLPRGGLVVLLVTALLMFHAARGIF